MAAARPPRVALLSMPYGALERPALGLSLLRAELQAAGVECEVHYLNYAFSRSIGLREYLWMQGGLPYTAFAGDWSFTAALHGEDPERTAAYEREVLHGTWRLDASALRRIRQVAAAVPAFLDRCLAALPWDRFAIVGFTSTFEQNIASLALARRLKLAHPGLVVVFGGANWEGEMGLELHRRFAFVDYVCSGEADRSFPELACRVLAGAPPGAVADIPGIVYREKGESRSTGPALPVRDLDATAVPDFREFFTELNKQPYGEQVAPVLLMETSRGCWWGARSHCTFCGLNGGSMAFRSKSAGRVLGELRELVGRWGVDFVEVVDNILDMRYFDDLLPGLAAWAQHPRLFYEVKANLTRAQVRLLAEAGVTRIQPGIESLSDHVLGLMRKGTTALRNIQLLKWCRQYGVEVDWNLLYGFPGETADDYLGMLPLLEAIRFLGPPCACGPVRMDRFSPYFETPSAFGLRNVRPLECYRHLYPGASEESLSRIAYYFDFDYDPEVDPGRAAAPVIDFVERWRREPERGVLNSAVLADGSLLLLDRREGAGRRFVLTGPERLAYEHCDSMHTARSVLQAIEAGFSEERFEADRVAAFLESVVANRLMVTDGTYYLSLALPLGGAA